MSLMDGGAAILKSRGFKTQIYNPNGRVKLGQTLTRHGYIEERIVLMGFPISSRYYYIYVRLDDQLLGLKEKTKRIFEYAK